MTRATILRSVLARVRADHTLPMGARLLLHEIAALSDRDGRCGATNRHLSERLGEPERTVKHWLHLLDDAGYLVRSGGTRSRALELADKGNTLPESTPVLSRIPHSGNSGNTLPESPTDSGKNPHGDSGKNPHLSLEDNITTPERGEDAGGRAREEGDGREGENGRPALPENRPGGRAFLHPAVEVAAAYAGTWPQVFHAEQIVVAVRLDDASALAVWEGVCASWTPEAGRNPGNVPGMLNAFARQCIETRRLRAEEEAVHLRETQNAAWQNDQRQRAQGTRAGAPPPARIAELPEARRAREEARRRELRAQGIFDRAEAEGEAAAYGCALSAMFAPLPRVPEGAPQGVYYRRVPATRTAATA